MIQKIRKTFALLATALMLAAPVAIAVPAMASADSSTLDALCGGAVLTGNDTSGTTGGATCTTDSGIGGTNDATTTLASLASTVINIFSIVVGVVSVIMIIIGGFRYVTSGGESNSVSSAKNTIIYAIIGLVVVALAQFIVKFVLQKLSTSGLSS